jgi:prepilin-type N-terminal cleavage/methylation domain-containing protein
MRYHREGFTLVELVMTLIIIGVLVSFAIPRFISMSKEAERAVVEKEIPILIQALNIYSMKQLASNLPITPHNPFDDMEIISNYAGAFPDIDGTNCPAGYWAYQIGDPLLNGGWSVLVYRTKSSLTQAFSWGGIQWIILVESVVSDANGKAIGLALTEYPPPHQW